MQRPPAFGQKSLNASVAWGWPWVCPQQGRWRQPGSGEQGRHHLDPSLIQKAVRRAVLAAGISKPATCWSGTRRSARFRSYWATAISTQR
ncbi:protein of unknown function [Cyanobium sp. NIES-981]|nr:protein of unknown function [Cyanobium sp. NIES-981]